MAALLALLLFACALTDQPEETLPEAYCSALEVCFRGIYQEQYGEEGGAECAHGAHSTVRDCGQVDFPANEEAQDFLLDKFQDAIEDNNCTVFLEPVITWDFETILSRNFLCR